MSTISFYGGSGMVTGANFVLRTSKATIMVDCGLIQGERFALETNCEPFPYDPSTIEVLLVTHAHADHIGRIPKLVAEGFRGVIYSTPATADLASVMLEDAFKVMEYESERSGVRPCYEKGDIARAFRVWKSIPYETDFELPDQIIAQFSNAGHILGSAMVTLTRNDRSFVFTGDIGNVPQPLLPPPSDKERYDYLLMESVYGDRIHEGVTERSDLLLSYIKDTIKKNGTLIIPAFSLERTQAMLYEINNFVEKKDIMPIPVFLDSPLAIKVTEIYKKHIADLKPEVQRQIESGDDIFDFPRLHFTRTMKQSSEIANIPGAKIIIAGSGMSHGGRILAHEKRYLSDPKTTLLLVGYQATGSIGRLLQDGVKKVRIGGEALKVNARIGMIHGYSGHADRDQLVAFVGDSGKSARQVFVAMGEERAALFLVQRLRDYLGAPAVAPALNDVYEIDF